MKRLIIAMTGASGSIYGVRALEILRAVEDVETHLILSPSAARTLAARIRVDNKRLARLTEQFSASR